jgi:hypothetical protein
MAKKSQRLFPPAEAMLYCFVLSTSLSSGSKQENRPHDRKWPSSEGTNKALTRSSFFTQQIFEFVDRFESKTNYEVFAATITPNLDVLTFLFLRAQKSDSLDWEPTKN